MLGSLAVTVDGVSAQLGSPSERRVLAALVAGGGVAGRERLVEALWGENPPPSALHSLQTYISRLRRALGGDCIQTRPPGWALVADIVDVYEFERDLAGARAGSTSHPVTAFDAALSWWRGPAFEEFAGEPFALAEARRLDELRLGARVDRAAALLETDQVSDGVAELEGLVAEQPLHERAWELLVRGLASGGRSAAALRAAHRCRTELASIGLEPSAALVHAEKAALSREPPPRAAADARTTRYTLPSGIGEFVGRQAELIRVEQVFQVGPGCVTVVGPGGVGKTRFAIELAAALGSRFPAGVFFCDLSAVEQADSVVAAITTAIDAPLSAPVEERLTAFCAPRELLLVVDNCEHLVHEAARITSRLLDAAPRLAIVATSREPLRIRRETVVSLGPLEVTDAVHLYQLRAASAGAMPDDSDAIESLVIRLDNLPLAIEMAAGWSRSLTARELTIRVGVDRGLLSHVAHDVVPRHRTLDATIAWSYDLLPEGERRLLERLSVFASAIDLDNALAVAAPDQPRTKAARTLVNLVDRSLVLAERTADETRYRLLESTRSFAHDALQRRGAFDDALADHAHWAMQFAEDFAVGFRGPDAPRWADRAESLLPELRACVYRCLDHGWFDDAFRVVGALTPLVYEWLRADLADWATHCIETARAEGLAVPHSVSACAALGPLQEGELDAAYHATAGLTGAWAAVVRSDTGLYRGDYQSCIRDAETAVDAARAEGNDVLVALGLFNQSLAHAYLGDDDIAFGIASEVRRVADATGAPSAMAWADFLDGELLLDRSPAHARPLLERALARAREIRSSLTEGISLVSLTTLQARHGDATAAVPAFQDAIRHWQQRDDWTHQRVTLRNLVTLLERLELDEPAAVLLGVLEDQAPESDDLRESHRMLHDRLAARLDTFVARGRLLDQHEVVHLALDALASVGSKLDAISLDSGDELLCIVFTDLVGWTALDDRIDDDAADELRREHLSAVRAALDAHRGREIKTAGDSVMATFRSALDALRCAVAIQDAAGSTSLQVRIGVHAGELIADENDVFGTAVNIASRLCAAAAPGEVLVSDLTRSRLGRRGGFDLEDAGPLELKGLRDRVRAFRLRVR